jgi:hypothetical protein
MSKPEPRVEQHLKKNGVKDGQLPNSVIDALNKCSQEELDAMDMVGDALENEKVSSDLRIAAMH